MTENTSGRYLNGLADIAKCESMGSCAFCEGFVLRVFLVRMSRIVVLTVVLTVYEKKSEVAV